MRRNVDIYVRPDIAGASNGKAAVAALMFGHKPVLYSYAPSYADRDTIIQLYHKAVEKLNAKQSYT